MSICRVYFFFGKTVYFDLLPIFWLGSQASFQVLSGISGILRRCCSGIWPHFALRWECGSFSRVTAVSLVFLSCCNGEFKSPFMFLGRAQDCYWVTAGELGLISHWGGNLVVFFKLHMEAFCFSSCHSVSREPLMLPQGSLACFQVAIGPRDCFWVAAGE